MPMLTVSCVNGKAAKELVQYVQNNDGNTKATVFHAVANIPADTEEYASTVLNIAFSQNWITGSQFAHAMTNFQNALGGLS